jgi:hypothetical protein
MNISSLILHFSLLGVFAFFTFGAEAADRCAVATIPASATADRLARSDYIQAHPGYSSPIRWPTSTDIMQWMMSRAEEGDAKAQWIVAEEIIRSNENEGCGISGDQIKEAKTWLLRSAERGFGPAKS